jgi:hypothetical protein
MQSTRRSTMGGITASTHNTSYLTFHAVNFCLKKNRVVTGNITFILKKYNIYHTKQPKTHNIRCRSLSGKNLINQKSWNMLHLPVCQIHIQLFFNLLPHFLCRHCCKVCILKDGWKTKIIKIKFTLQSNNTVTILQHSTMHIKFYRICG